MTDPSDDGFDPIDGVLEGEDPHTVKVLSITRICKGVELVRMGGLSLLDDDWLRRYFGESEAPPTPASKDVP